MKIGYCCTMILSTLALAAASPDRSHAQERMMAPPATDAAQPEEGESLARPDIERWIYLGATVGHGPIEEGATRTFGPTNPGRILITQMEPAAYDYFRKNGRYGDGTTFAVSFYDPIEKPDPEMDGLAAGDKAFLVVHRLDRTGDGVRHAFYGFKDNVRAKRLPEGNECEACHTKNGDLEGTFVQFYPALRERLQKD